MIKDYSAKFRLKAAVRLTPVDVREGPELEHMWHGRHWDLVLEVFERCAAAGADFLAIESVGGKEVHDDAIMYGDICDQSDKLELWNGLCMPVISCA